MNSNPFEKNPRNKFNRTIFVNLHLFYRQSHRWLGLLTSLQLLMWTVSGLFFTLPDIKDVRGEQYLVKSQSQAIDPLVTSELFSITNIIEAAKLSEEEEVSIKLKRRSGQWVYEIERPLKETLIFDALSGKQRSYLVESEVINIVRSETNLEPINAVLINTPLTGSEFRGRDLPLYKVSVLKPQKGVVYIDPLTGEIVAVRTKLWRAWDFLWSLHIMDYRARDDFSHGLIRVFAILGLLTVLSGMLLWYYSSKYGTSKNAG